MPECFLGIDTSNYKTSVALTSADGEILFARSELLPVERGKRGLRQSVAFFHHVNRLPDFIREAMQARGRRFLTAVAVSEAPRPVQGSYMPVFLAGLRAAETLAAALDIPLYRFSHQQGHIAAILQETSVWPKRAIFFHLSGGTTECLLTEIGAADIQTQIVGGSKDISIGQLLDRSGVQLGYPFPAGAALDEIAGQHPVCDKPAHIRVQDGWFNLSGTEFQVKQAIEHQGEAIIPGLFERIGELLLETAELLAKRYDCRDIYLAGGVAASKTVRAYIRAHTGQAGSIQVHFGHPQLSGDNAVGIACLGGRVFHESH